MGEILGGVGNLRRVAKSNHCCCTVSADDLSYSTQMAVSNRPLYIQLVFCASSSHWPRLDRIRACAWRQRVDPEAGGSSLCSRLPLWTCG